LIFSLLIGLSLASGAWAEARSARVRYAEPVVLQGLPPLPRSGAQKTAGSIRIDFDAFGRRFDLQLEPNERVLRKLSGGNRGQLPAHALYRGTVAGLPGSWVRLTRLRDGIRGLVFDGDELYVLAPAGALQGQLDVLPPGVDRRSTLVYRASDTDGGLGPDFCRVLQPPDTVGTPGAAGKEPAYKAILAELHALAPQIEAALPQQELDLALVGDTQLASRFVDATGEMLARLNNIDGIFGSQVGVKVTSGFVQVLANSGGLGSTVPETLLDQFEAYRKATPEAASRGLAHLMTGRDLDGSTVGIAYLGTLCAPQFAVSLSQTYLDTFYSSLVAAHELGHNFGAPHDGASGSACAATPQDYLMAKVINGSSTFSACSLGQIAPVVSAATCLAPAKVADVGVQFAGERLEAYALHDVHVPVDVVSAGNVTSSQVVLHVQAMGIVTIKGATAPAGTCSTDGTTLTCQLGDVAAGETQQVDVVVRSGLDTTATLQASVQASADADATNNGASLRVAFASPADGAVTLSTNSLSAYVGEPQSFYVTASNAGPLALENATVVMQNPGLFTILSAGGPGIPCSVTATETTCAIGSIPAGESRRIDISLAGIQAWGNTVPVSLSSTNDLAYGNDTAYLTVRALPLVELTIDAEPGPSLIRIGDTITQSFTLRSAGPQPVNEASFLLQPGIHIGIVDVSGDGATCAPVGDAMHSFRCTYASPIESGGTRRLDAILEGLSGTSDTVLAIATAPDSQHLDAGRGSVVLQYEIRSNVDLQLGSLFGGADTFDHRTVSLRFPVASIGLSPAVNSRFTLALAQGLRATGARTTVGSCALAVSAVACALSTMAPGEGGTVTIDVVADEPGSYVASASIAADGDSNPSNDTTEVRIDARPNVDLALGTLPASASVRVGSTIDYPLVVTAASQPVSNSMVAFTVYGGVSAVLATATQGDCEPVAAQFRCLLGTVPAGGSATVNLRLRGDTASSGLLEIRATGTGDVDASNGYASPTIDVVARGNVSLQRAASNVTATVGTSVDLPRLTLRALAATDDVRVDLTVPSAFSVDSATADGAPCSVNAGIVRCAFGTLAAGTSRGINLRLRSNRASTYSVAANASAADDADTSDNATSVSITVNKAASSGGGGGGGGSLDPATLLLVLVAPALARRRRHRTAT